MRYIPIYFLLLISIIFSLNNKNSSLFAELLTKTNPALATKSCKAYLQKDWTTQEKLVWMQACEGKEANFNEAKGYGGELDPGKKKTGKKKSMKTGF